eukprot:Em0012g397a
MAPSKPNDLYAGIVEVCHNGYWGTICTDSLTRSWSEKNAHMACWNAIDPVTKLHPYSGALNSIILRTLPKSYQVPQSVQIHYRSVVCDGTEETFAYCSHISTNTSTCTHDYDAAVVCRQTAADGSVRLYGGSDPAIGNVEVLYNGVWGAVCATGWNENAGRLVCAQLGYDPNSDYFGMGFAGR